MDRAPTLHIYAASGHKKLRPRSPGRLGAGDKHSIEAAEGIPALLIQRPGFRTVIQMLNPLDVVLGGGIVYPGDITGFHAVQDPRQPAEHGLHQVKMNAGLTRCDGKLWTWKAAGGQRSEAGNHLVIQGNDSVPGGLVYLSGDRREKFPLKEHDGL